MLSSPLCVAQISDTHFPHKSGELFRGVDCVAQLTHLLRIIRRRQPKVDLLLVTGDISHQGESASYRLWLECLNSINCPILALPGNHDSPLVMREVFAGTIRLDAVSDYENWRIISLNTVREGDSGGYLSVSELKVLQQALESAGNQSVLIAMHHHPTPVLVDWLDDMALDNAEDFWAIVDQYPQVRGVVWGHIHHAFSAQRRDVVLWGAPASSVQFVPEFSSQAAFRLIRCYPDGRLKSDIIRLT